MALQRAPSGAGWVIPGSAEAAGKRKNCHCRGCVVTRKTTWHLHLVLSSN